MSCTCTDFQAGAIGVKIRIELKDCGGAPVPLTDVTTLQILFKLGTSATITKTAIVDGPPADGALYYVTVPGDFTAAGTWKAQASVTFANGSSYRSREVTFKVLKNL